MKKNYIYISIPIVLLVLFISLVYRSSKDKIEGSVDIFISLAADSLSNEEKDSLVTQLVPLYSGQNQNTYYFSTIQFLDSDKTKIDVPTSMINKIRGFFSHSFYTSEERINANSLFIKNYPSIAEKYRKAFASGKSDESGKIKIYYSKTFKKLSEFQANSISSLRLKIEEVVKKNPGKQILICHITNKIDNVDNNNSTNQNGNTNGQTGENEGGNNVTDGNTVNGNNPNDNSRVDVLKNNSTIIDFAVVEDLNTFTLSNSNPDVNFSYSIACIDGCKGVNDFSAQGSADGNKIQLNLKKDTKRIRDRLFEITVTTTTSDNRFSRSDKKKIVLRCSSNN
jgi:hypothetical protein